jgi:hypothetical protein
VTEFTTSDTRSRETLSSALEPGFCNGSSAPVSADDITHLIAIRELLGDAGREFLAAHVGLEKREAAASDTATARSFGTIAV